jgi:predicted NACHT family NTPase
MLENADELLVLMKQKIDALLSGDEEFLKFLTWVEQKSKSVEARYKPAAVRAFYLDLPLAIERALDLNLAVDRALPLDLAVDLNLPLALDQAVDLDLSLAIERALPLALDFDLSRTLALARNLYPKLERSLQQLKNQLPNPEDEEAYKQWWLENGQAWTDQLRAVMIEHRNIGHDWQFTDAQKGLLKQYYDANKLLVDCLNSDCYVSREVRQKIEDTLLLPVKK